MVINDLKGKTSSIKVGLGEVILDIKDIEFYNNQLNVFLDIFKAISIEFEDGSEDERVLESFQEKLTETQDSMVS